MTGKVALITGVTGQDGAYLAEFLLDKGLCGPRHQAALVARSTPGASTISIRIRTTRRICVPLHYGDMTDATNLIRIVQETQPTRSTISRRRATCRSRFETPEYTANADALGTLRLLEAIRILGLGERECASIRPRRRSCTARCRRRRRRETTPFYPRSPLCGAKLYAYWITVNYREAYGMHASNGILFNHEGPTRGETFVTRKITRAVAAIQLGLQDKLYLGNLDAKRDWGHARDYVEGMWLMLQQAEPDDYVLATGETPFGARVRREGLCPRRPPHRMARQRRRGEGRRSRQRIACWSRSIRAISARPRSISCSAIRPRRAQKLGWRHRVEFRRPGRRDGRSRSRQDARGERAPSRARLSRSHERTASVRPGRPRVWPSAATAAWSARRSCGGSPRSVARSSPPTGTSVDLTHEEPTEAWLARDQARCGVSRRGPGRRHSRQQHATRPISSPTTSPSSST